jgi:hypothetical protein
MKVEIAPAGTDPTKQRTPLRSAGGLPDVIRSNGLLVAAVFGFIAIGLLTFGGGGGGSSTGAPAAATPTPAVMAIQESRPAVGYCEYGPILIREGETVNVGGDIPGGKRVNCSNGTIAVVPIPEE